MKAFISFVLTLGFGLTAQAGIFDGTPLDPRSPVEKCQDFAEESFSSGSEFLAACGRITTNTAFKCLKTVTKNKGGLSKIQISACSFVNTKEAEKAVEGVVERLSTISAIDKIRALLMTTLNLIVL